MRPPGGAGALRVHKQPAVRTSDPLYAVTYGLSGMLSGWERELTSASLPKYANAHRSHVWLLLATIATGKLSLIR
jgi:hypothetical protein